MLGTSRLRRSNPLLTVQRNKLLMRFCSKIHNSLGSLGLRISNTIFLERKLLINQVLTHLKLHNTKKVVSRRNSNFSKNDIKYLERLPQ